MLNLLHRGITISICWKSGKAICKVGGQPKLPEAEREGKENIHAQL